jgi:hypothetical protein
VSRKLSHSRYFHPGLPFTVILLALLSVDAGAEVAADGRLAYDEASPPWLRAVGVLTVPTVKYQDGRARNHREDCSATLVTGRRGQPADIIVTAWHCLEFYRDLSKPITFTLGNTLQGGVSHRARRLADGGGMSADWAILRLQRAIPADSVSAIQVHPGVADPQRGITAAGYSRDTDRQQRGRQLTYDPTCRILQREELLVQSDCAAHKGASGGAVVQISAEGVAQLSGVISQGDGEAVLLYVPVDEFRQVLARYL